MDSIWRRRLLRDERTAHFYATAESSSSASAPLPGAGQGMAQLPGEFGVRLTDTLTWLRGEYGASGPKSDAWHPFTGPLRGGNWSFGHDCCTGREAPTADILNEA